MKLIFLQLDALETAIARVAERLQQGGHDIPEAAIRRRFVAGLDKLRGLYARSVDTWALYNNAGREPVLLDWRVNNE